MADAVPALSESIASESTEIKPVIAQQYKECMTGDERVHGDLPEGAL